MEYCRSLQISYTSLQNVYECRQTSKLVYKCVYMLIYKDVYNKRIQVNVNVYVYTFVHINVNNFYTFITFLEND